MSGVQVLYKGDIKFMNQTKGSFEGNLSPPLDFSKTPKHPNKNPHCSL
jgi:hypothetical protein